MPPLRKCRQNKERHSQGQTAALCKLIWTIFAPTKENSGLASRLATHGNSSDHHARHRERRSDPMLQHLLHHQRPRLNASGRCRRRKRHTAAAGESRHPPWRHPRHVHNARAYRPYTRRGMGGQGDYAGNPQREIHRCLQHLRPRQEHQSPHRHLPDDPAKEIFRLHRADRADARSA